MPPRIVAGVVVRVSFLVALTAGLSPAQEAPTATEKADRAFADLLSAAKKDPEKADWKALRHAFAETSRYHPYNIKWRDELAAVREQIEAKRYKEAEAALDALMEREGFMRLDAHGVATVLYDRSGQKDKLDFHSRFAQGIASALFAPGRGLSIEKPIEVLFVDEEYLFLDALELGRKRQALREKDGHWIDVQETKTRDGKDGDTFYFNIDMPRGALQKMLGGLKARRGEK